MSDADDVADDSVVDVVVGAAPRPKFEWGAGTHVGGVRDHNEDAFFVSPDACVVADGMGGHAAGEVASQLVTHIVAGVFEARRLEVSELPGFVSALNAAVLRKGAENNTRGMGTTVVGVAVAENGDGLSAVVFHVGDSRCYRLCDGVMTQLTSDHSHVQELVQAGRITAEEALTHPLRNVITRALGADVAVEADFHVLDDENCRLLLCSDGLSGELDDDRIRDLLTANADPSTAAVALIDAVLSGPARDNVTAIVVDVTFPDLDLEMSAGSNSSVGVPTESTVDDTADITAEVAADITAEVAADVTAEVDTTENGPGEHTQDPADEVLNVRPWAPPEVVGRRSADIDRPLDARDGAAWASPAADSADPIHATDQETGHASHEHH